ncbi:hypothetical protein N5I19_11440 [Pseudomonas chengduensis]|nr:hypothetical protein [Pseudomonas chengduensis]MDH1559569.1 hypothetical protein [Pseudomonas chengduensis]
MNATNTRERLTMSPAKPPVRQGYRYAMDLFGMAMTSALALYVA